MASTRADELESVKNDPVNSTIRLAIARWPQDAPRGAVTAFCEEHGISRKTFYQIRKRAQTEGKDAVKVFRKGIEACGVPQRLLTDNGDALNPIRRGVLSELVAYANGLGIATITGKPYKPTTQGKNERFHSTLFKWLKKQPFATDLIQLQAQLDVFDQAYNTQRGHQSLEERMTPQEAWDATAVAEPLEIGQWKELSTKPGPSEAALAVCLQAGGEREAQRMAVARTPPEPVKLSGTLPSEHTGESGNQVLRANKNRCLRVAGVEIYLGKLLRSTMVNVVWDPTDLMVLGINGELVAKFDYPFPQGVKYLSLRHATVRFQNMPDPV